MEHLLELLYNNHMTAMYHKAHSVLSGHGLAEDAVQEAFLRISKHLSRIETIPIDRLRYLCLAIVKSTAIDIYRVRGVTIPLPDSTSAVVTDPSTGIDIAAAINNLDDEYQQIVILRLLYGFDTAETARLLGLTQSQVFNRLSRAKKMLRNALTENETDNQNPKQNQTRGVE
jgi:RNA polymerase sigma-70 factor (ECF subfamily)